MKGKLTFKLCIHDKTKLKLNVELNQTKNKQNDIWLSFVRL